MPPKGCCPICRYRVGVAIKERQHNGYRRVIVDVSPYDYVIAERAGRRTRIAWKNLRRYEIVP